MKKCKFVVYVAILTSVLVAMLISIIEWRAYDLSFYEETYEELHTYEYIGMSQEDLMNTTDVLLSYMRRERSDMVVEATIKGQKREVFNDREKLHMIDVNALIKAADTFMFISYGMFALLIGYLFYKKEHGGWRELGKAGLVSVTLLFAMMGVLVGFILIDFNSFWTLFHKVFFTNDLWLLNPRTDVMIQMFPLEFFYKVVMQIAISYIVFLVTFTLLCVLGVRKKDKMIA